MCADTKGVLATVEGIALLVVADTALGELLAREVQRYMNLGTLTVVSQLAQASERLRVTAPLAILLDEAILLGALLIELLRQFTETAPVILLGAIQQWADLSRLVAEGDLEFVASTGDFIPLAASLIERRLRWAEHSESSLGPPRGACPPAAPKSSAT